MTFPENIIEKFNLRSLFIDSKYTRAPRQQERYRWWKPIPIAIIAFIVWIFLFGFLMGIISGAANLSLEDVFNLVGDGYDGTDFVSVPGIIMNIGTLGLFIPSLFIATKIFRLKFGLMTSVFGHMRWKLLGKCLIVSAIFYGVLSFGIPPFMDLSEYSSIGLSTAIALLIIVPLQCAAEEYLFRGFIMQTFGCWIPWTIVAVIIQTIVFASQHPYNLAGQVSVAITAIVFAYLAIRTGGLEAGIAAHSINNLIAFFTAAVEVSEVTADIEWASTIVSAIFEIAFAICLVKIGDKYNWFGDFSKVKPEVNRKMKKNDILGDKYNAAELAERQQKLIEFFTLNNKVAIAFSGGVDSSYLLKAAKEAGADFKAYYVKGPFQPEFEFEDAKNLAADVGARLVVIEANPLTDERVAANPSNRCYYCKQKVFGLILQEAKVDGYTLICDGTNASDDADDRPGMKALEELEVKSPLRESGLTKTDVRRLSKKAGLFTWDKPSYACLATRIPAGSVITPEKLERTERAENYLFSLGFTDFRVRMPQDDTAKIQLPADQMPLFLEKREEIAEELKKYYKNVVLDVESR